MKFFHLSDLHLGKRLCGFSLIDDQSYILNQILQLVDSHHPDALLLAGDLYDKPVPPVEAVALLDHFLEELAGRGLPTLLISGNHDSPQRLAFGARLLYPAESIWLPSIPAGWNRWSSGFPWPGLLLPASLSKARPSAPGLPQAQVESYTDAMQVAIQALSLDPAARNLLVTHQFVTGSLRSESEELSVGGADNVDAAVFDPFDYVALGHLHTPQQVGRPTLRYSGSPLAYSFSEANSPKSVAVVELGEKGQAQVSTLPLRPRRPLRELTGSYDWFTLLETYQNVPWREDYLRLVLTDPQEIPDAAARLRVIYPNLMQLAYRRPEGRAWSPFPWWNCPISLPWSCLGSSTPGRMGNPWTPARNNLSNN